MATQTQDIQVYGSSQSMTLGFELVQQEKWA